MDIYDLGYIYFSVDKENEHAMNRDIDNKFAGNSLLGILDFALRFFYYLVHSPFGYKNSLKKNNAVLIYGESVNNRNTLLPIIKELGQDQVIDLHSLKQYPKWRVYWYAIPHLGEFIREIKRNSPEKQDTIKNFFAKFWMMYGCDKASGKLLDYYRPRALVVANDHLPFHRSLMNEANKRRIPTIYVQHAAVTEKFPPLHFAYSLLDGEDSYNKYKLNEETSGHIYLCGGIRFDAIKMAKNEGLGKSVVGVAINLVDDESIVKEMCLQMKDSATATKPITVILRPHPQMQLDIWREWCSSNNIGFSNPKEQTSFEFLSGISMLVSNQSSIHLDAAMCHTPSIVYNLSSKESVDYYSFVKNGLAKKVENIEELIEIIADVENYQLNHEAVKYYNCSYGTNYEGNVAKVMADLIDCIQRGEEELFVDKYCFRVVERSDNRVVYRV